LSALRTSPNIVSADAERILAEEIAPLLHLGQKLEATIYREFGFDPAAFSASHPVRREFSDEFIEIDYNGEKAT
jgi:hypothetical protein